MKKTLAILGAIDRFNYGDLLFPLIIERALDDVSPEYDFEYYGFKRSDLSAYGAKKTRSLRDLVRRSPLREGSGILIAGGDVLGINWMPMHLHQLDSLRARLFASYFTIFGKAFGRGLAINARLARRYGAEPFTLPWIVPVSALGPDVRIVYNTVSGSALHTLPPEYQFYLKDNMNKADLITVRDSHTRDALRSIGVTRSVSLVPDSAVLMSRIFPADVLESKVRPEIRRWIASRNGDYLCFQIKQSLGRKHIPQIVQALNAVSRTLKTDILLLPVGRVPMHEDHLILRRIRQALNLQTFLPDEPTLFEIMTCIARSRLFIGTSLHGVITAMSFAVPHLGLVQETPKLAAFLQDWGAEPSKSGASIDQIADRSVRVLESDIRVYTEKRADLIRRVQNHYSGLCNLFSDGHTA